MGYTALLLHQVYVGTGGSSAIPVAKHRVHDTSDLRGSVVTLL
jgi:hypothetical protein